MAEKKLLNLFRRFTAFGVLPALLMLLLAASTATAQTETGQISGTVSDSTGAVIGGASITTKSADTKAERQTTTSASGAFTIANLPPGPYEVKVEAPGFSSKLLKVQVTVGSRVSVDAVLDVGQSETIIEVVGTEAGIQVNTNSQELSDVVTQKQLRELPTITRNPYDLVALSGNISPGDPSGRGVGFAINGQRAASTNVLLDGADNNDNFTATVGQNVPLDSVQEFSVITSNFSAEYGRASGGVVNLATKSGTNEYHGTIYEFNRVAALASNTFDNNAQYDRIEKGIFTRNQFGYSAGGPVIKEKIFFFSSGEFIRVRSAAPTTFLVPTQQLLAVSSPNTQAFFAPFKLASPINGRVITRGEIPGLNPSGPFAQLPAGLPVFGQVVTSIPSDAGGGDPQNSYQFVNRLDWTINNKTTLYARYALESQNFIVGSNSSSPYQGFNTGSEAFNNNILLSLTRVFTPRLTTQTKAVFNRLNQQQPLGDQPVGPTLYAQSIRARILGDPLAFPGYLPLNPGNAIPFGGPQNLSQFYEDVNFSIGKHELRFGGSYVHIQDNRTFGAYLNAVVTLSNSLSGALDNFVRGQARTFQAAIDPKGKFPGDTITTPVGPPSFSRSNRYNEYALYANDSFRIHPRVTLNLGVRYEYFGVQHNKDPRLDSNFYDGAGATIFDQIRNGKVFVAPDSPAGGLYEKDTNDVAPRIGVAWDIFGDGKTSLRFGYGVGYERNFGNVTFNVLFNPPNFFIIAIAAPTDVPSIPISLNNAGPLSGSGVNKLLPRAQVRNVKSDIRTAYAQIFSASLQHQVLKGLRVSLDYSGSNGFNLYSLENPNRVGSGAVYLNDADPNARLNKQYAALNRRGNSGLSRYHSMTIGVEGNVPSLGVQFTNKYTWSHSIDNLSSTFSESANNFNLGLLDPFNPGLDRGNADFDIRHRFISSGVWDIPFANKTKGFKKALLDGWGINFIYNATTGTPFSIFDCTNAVFEVCPRLGELGKLSRTGPDNPPAAAPDQPNRFTYIDLTNQLPGAGAFLNPITGTSEFGPFPQNMTARNAFRGPGAWTVDGSITKKIQIGERYGLQFRAEFFNAFNHPNLFVIGGEAEVNTGFVPATKDGRRNIQLGLKFLF